MGLITGLENTAYHIRVSSKNSSGESGLSGEQTITPSASYASTTPATPEAPSPVIAGDESIALQWFPVKYAKSYNIYYYQSDSSANSDTLKTSGKNLPVTAKGGKQSARITGLDNGKTYQVSISAVNGAYESALTASYSKAPQGKPPLVMTNTTYIIGYASERFPNEEAGHGDRLARKKETAFGDLTGDAIVWWALRHKGDASPAYEGVDFGFFNGGVIQGGINQGDITIGQVRTVYYGDPLSYITLTGEQVRTLFKDRVAKVPHTGGGGSGTGAFGQVSGDVNFTLNYNGTKSEGVIEELKIFKGGEWQYLVKDRADVSTYNSEPYRIITSTWLIDGGDGYGAYLGIGTLRRDTGVVFSEAAANYIYYFGSSETSPLKPADFFDGRLTLKGELWQ